MALLPIPEAPLPAPRKAESPHFLARPRCHHCGGFGVVRKPYFTGTCQCVCRAVFRDALERYHSVPGMGWRHFSRWAEYRADFELIAQRLLSAAEKRIFREVFLRGAGWPEAAHGMTRGDYFHLLYRVERLCGRAILGARPHSVWPTAEYFAGTREMAEAIIYGARKQWISEGNSGKTAP